MSKESLTTYGSALKSMIPPRCDGCPNMSLLIKRTQSLDEKKDKIDNPKHFIVMSNVLRNVVEGYKPKGDKEKDFYKYTNKLFTDLFGVSPEEVIEMEAPRSDAEAITTDLLKVLEAQYADEFEALASELDKKVERCASAADTCHN